MGHIPAALAGCSCMTCSVSHAEEESGVSNPVKSSPECCIHSMLQFYKEELPDRYSFADHDT